MAEKIDIFDNYGSAELEVVFQDDVHLENTVDIRYVKFGEEDIQTYVRTVAKPELETFAATQKKDIGDYTQIKLSNAEAEIKEYTDTEIKGELDALLSAAQTAETSAGQAAIAAANAEASAESYSAAAAVSAENAEYYAQRASIGNIGDIRYTVAKNAPVGGVWCDGKRYTKEQFPEFYQKLVDGEFWVVAESELVYGNEGTPGITEELDEEAGTYAAARASEATTEETTEPSYGYFILDETGQTFRVPLLKDIFIECSNSNLAPALKAPALPNITGALVARSGASVAGSVLGASAAFNLTAKGVGSNIANITLASTASTGDSIKFDASRSNSIYKTGATVQPPAVTYRAYVVLYTAAVEATAAQAAAFISNLDTQAEEFQNKLDTQAATFQSSLDSQSTQLEQSVQTQISSLNNNLSSKADTGLVNVSPSTGFKRTSTSWGLPNYSSAITAVQDTWTQVTTDSLITGGSNAGTNLQSFIYISSNSSGTPSVIAAYSYGYACVLSAVVPKNWYYKITCTGGYRTMRVYPLRGVS